MTDVFRYKNIPPPVVFTQGRDLFCFRISFKLAFREFLYVSKQVSMFQFKFLFITINVFQLMCVPQGHLLH